jgi:hypothetical protein
MRIKLFAAVVVGLMTLGAHPADDKGQPLP